LYRDWFHLFRAGRSKAGGRVPRSRAYWMATAFYTNPEIELGPKENFDLKHFLQSVEDINK
jgi:hypothetical protein